MLQAAVVVDEASVGMLHQRLELRNLMGAAPNV
jgi:hypothetical protein